MAGPFTTPVAQSVPLENKDAKDNDFKALNVQEGMEEIDFRREIKEPTGFLDISQVHVHYESVGNKIQVIPTGAEFTFYIWGCRFDKTATEEIALPTAEDWYTVYYGEDGNLSYTSGFDNDREYDEKYFKVAHVYYSAVEGRVIWWSDASSLVSMQWGTQRRFHGVRGTEHNAQDFLFKNFIENGDGTLDAHAQLGLNGGRIFHEDVFFDIVHSTTPTGHFEQDIDSIAQIPILYRSGANGVWRKKDATDFPLYENIGGRCYYNEYTGSTWQLTEAQNNRFVSVYYYATTNPDEPIIGLLGNIDGSSPAKSIDQALKAFAGFPNHDFSFLKVAIWQTSDLFTNSVKTRLFNLTDGIEALSNDRYAIKAEYNGNANSGRYLELATGQSSDDQPLLMPEDSFIRTITLQAASNMGIGKSVGFYESGNLVTPRFAITVPVGGLQEHIFEVTEFFNKGEKIVVKIIDGSIQKPVVRFWIETSA